MNGADLILVRPDADGKTGQESGAQRRCFYQFRALYRQSKDIGLELHEKIVGAGSAIHL